jgi:hypothetical protein
MIISDNSRFVLDRMDPPSPKLPPSPRLRRDRTADQGCGGPGRMNTIFPMDSGHFLHPVSPVHPVLSFFVCVASPTPMNKSAKPVSKKLGQAQASPNCILSQAVVGYRSKKTCERGTGGGKQKQQDYKLKAIQQPGLAGAPALVLPWKNMVLPVRVRDSTIKLEFGQNDD